MKNKKSHLPSKSALTDLDEQIKAARTAVAEQEARGHFDTYWHEKLARLLGAKSEVNDDS